MMIKMNVIIYIVMSVGQLSTDSSSCWSPDPYTQTKSCTKSDLKAPMRSEQNTPFHCICPPGDTDYGYFGKKRWR